MLLLDLVMVFSPLIGFIDQYNKIKTAKSSVSFSLKVPLLLILCNTLRIYFWFGKRFEQVMLWQSVVMIVWQFCMVELCTRFPSAGSQTGKSLFDVANFWNWARFEVYCQFYGVFNVFWIVMTFIFNNNTVYVEFLGTLALLLEAMLLLPQVIQNYTTKSTEGLSLVLIGTCLFGDLFKTAYFAMKGLPSQFILCGICQIALDLFVCWQIYRYSPPKMKNKDV